MADEANRPSVLVVDDDPSVRRLFTRMLEMQGYAASGAAHGDEALALARDRSFDLLVTDLVLPGASGIEVAQRLRRIHPGLQVIVISGYDESGTVEVEQQTGFRFLQKPVDIATMTREIETALRTSRD